jgi:hypothetical protein
MQPAQLSGTIPSKAKSLHAEDVNNKGISLVLTEASSKDRCLPYLADLPTTGERYADAGYTQSVRGWEKQNCS